jgi:hypothetical protein
MPNNLVISAHQMGHLLYSKHLSTRSAILLGLYYGFLIPNATGPSQLIYTRNFLLNNEGVPSNLSLKKMLIHKKILIASLAGLTLPQLILLLSVFDLPFTHILIQPHIWAIVILPCLFLY